MESLERIIPFDKALWASGYLRDLQVHHYYLWNLPDALMDSWESIKDQDRLLAGLIDQPGKTMDVYDFYSRQEREIMEPYRRHSRYFGVEHAISTALPNQRTGLLEIMSLYRSDSRTPFSPEERQLKEFLFPLITEAWCSNQVHYMVNAASRMKSASLAICDKFAWIRHAEPEFKNLVVQNWPDWTGPELPLAIARKLVSDKTASLNLGTARFSWEEINGLFLIQGHGDGRSRDLSRREVQIAELYASGSNYKAIAEALNIAPATVRNHISAIYKKLKVTSKIGLWQVLNEESPT